MIKISGILSKEDIIRIQEFSYFGKFIDSIPLNHNYSASFSAKSDPFNLNQNDYDSSKTDIASSSIIISKLILTLLEYISKLPKDYHIDQDTLLGLIVHMSMAIPRWFEEDKTKLDEQVIDDYKWIKEKHQSVYEIMEKFFSLVEQSLLISISIKERLSFYQYIIKKE